MQEGASTILKSSRWCNIKFYTNFYIIKMKIKTVRNKNIWNVIDGACLRAYGLSWVLPQLMHKSINQKIYLSNTWLKGLTYVIGVDSTSLLFGG